MCGIFGYVGNRTATPVLLDGLRTLEYRGYDSSGIYVPGYGAVNAVGPLDALIEKITDPIPGTIGIGHTRWATHGAPTEENAHPHLDMSHKIALVHNGIIENYCELKEGLIIQGYTFSSDTDSEVLAKLIGSLYTGTILTAVQAALKRVRGTYGILVSAEDNLDVLVAARMGSPIVIGVGTDGNLISSDASALLAHTKDVIYLEDGECALVRADTYQVSTIHGKALQRNPQTVEGDVQHVQKDGYEHFMLKEILEAPEVIRNTIRGRLQVDKGLAKLGGVESVLPALSSLQRLVIVGCGSAYYAGQVGRSLLEEYADLPVEVEMGSEYRYKKQLPDKNSAVLAITQSGETADTLASVREVKRLGLLTVGVVNAVGSSIARETDAGIYNHAGPEVAVASTKAFISQLTALVLLTLLIGRKKGMSAAEGKRIAKELAALPSILETYLKNTQQIQAVAKKYAGYTDMMYIGRKLHTPIAYEGSLKLKEVTYIHAGAYAGGELKHGSIALLDEQFPVVALVPQDDVYEKMISNIQEVKARKAPVLAIATEGDEHLQDLADDVLYIPRVHPMLQPIVSCIPLQLLAYYIGVEKGLNVDRPRNLAKSVTVE
jgi:glucosamine--fructose-6-phosphate aminotransferase (isomerizing)